MSNTKNTPKEDTRELVGVINGVKHFSNGSYEKLTDEIGYGGWVNAYFWILSEGSNKTKAQLFNIIESLGLTEKQETAVKALVKGLLNEAFRNTEQEMARFVGQLGFQEVLNNLSYPGMHEPAIIGGPN